MKFLQYINENNDGIVSIEELVEFLVDKCSPFLKEVIKKGKNMPVIYSGRNSFKYWFVKPVRKDRKPKDTPIEIHNYIDDVFYDNFGFRARSNAIFVTSDWEDARMYGSVYMIFPIGQFKYLYNPKVEDLWEDIEVFMRKNKPKGIVKHDDDIYYDMTEAWLDKHLSDYTTRDINKAINSGVEIMLNCKEYVAITAGDFQRLLSLYFSEFGIKKFDKDKVKKWENDNSYIIKPYIKIFKDE